MLLSIGDQVKPGTYRFHSCFTRVVNFEHHGCLLAVVDESIGPGPLNIVLRDVRAGAQPLGCRIPEFSTCPSKPDVAPRPISPQPKGCAPALPAIPALTERLPLLITSRSILFDGHRYHFTRRHRYDSTLALPAIDLTRFQHNLSAFGELLREAAPPKSLAFLLDSKRRRNFRTGFNEAFAEQITRGTRHIFQGRLLQGVRQLKGCGLGLTPAGDDFIAGLLIGLHLLQMLRGRDLQPTVDAVFRAARGKNIFSNTFLDLARRGLHFGHMKDLLLALTSGSKASVRRAGRKLLSVGETSGADLATGLFLTLQSSL